MIEREDVGSWLSGPPRAAEDAYPGARHGLPESGPGSMARLGRRLVAFWIDGVLCQVIAMGLLGYRQGSGEGALLPLAVFAVMHLLMVSTGGATVGHRLLGMQVQALPRGWAGPKRALIRTVLMCLGLPILVVGADGRGLHDRAAGTVLVRTR